MLINENYLIFTDKKPRSIAQINLQIDFKCLNETRMCCFYIK